MSLPIAESAPSGELVPINLKEVVPQGITTAIFDMDDLMINSHELDMQVFDLVLHDYGVDIHSPASLWTGEDEVSMFGLKLPDMFRLFLNKYGLSSVADPLKMSDDFYEKMLSALERDPLEPMPGLIDLIENLKAGGLKLAIASSARHKKIDIVLSKLGLAEKFTAIVSGEDDIKHGKPAPDIFLEAALKAGSKPEECIAFEDAKNGVESINAAHMFSVGVHNQFSKQQLGVTQDLSEANIQVDSLSQLIYR